MKKTNLGTVTFVLTCIFVFMYAFAKIYSAWIAGNTFGGWNNLIDLSLSIEGYYTVRIISDNFILPIIWCMVYSIYLFEIGHNKKIERFVFAITAIAILIELIFSILNYLQSSGTIYLWPLFLRIGFLLVFIMLFMDWTKELPGKILYVVLGGSYIGVCIFGCTI